MFKKLVHKVCNEKSCPKYGVAQEPGLYICEECQNELAPVYVTDKRLVATVAGVAGVVLAIGGALGYEYVVNDLVPAEAMRVLGGIDKLVKLQAPDRKIGATPVVATGEVFYQTGVDSIDKPFIERKQGDATVFTHTHKYKSGDEFHWEFVSNLDHVYFFNSKPGKVQLLGHEDRSAAGQVHMRSPVNPTGYYRMDDQPQDENFVVIYSEAPLDPYASTAAPAVVDEAQFGATVKSLERSGDAVVYHIVMPHVQG